MLTARMRRRWVVAPEPELGPATEGFGPLLGRLLALRGIADDESAKGFMNPRLEDLQDPAELPGCVAAAKRLVQAVADQQPVVVYGDYDVDGVTAASILWHTLRKLGHEAVSTYVPHRLEEGYGLNAEAFDRFAAEDVKPLVVSVDCGITAVAVAEHARALGVELIITDHHEFDPAALPAATALVHPGLPKELTGDDASAAGAEEEAASGAGVSPLCGAGVAFKLAWQVAREHCGSDRVPAEMKRLLMDVLPLAALGTVADVVPLVGENRVIVARGLARIKDTPWLGLNALLEAAELKSQKVDAYHAGFVLGPRLNACGRMGHAKEAVTLLTDASPRQAEELARFLTQQNDRRRATERKILAQAHEMVAERGDDSPDCRAIVLAHEEWHPGVIGIVASRLVEAYHRPAVLLGIDRETGLAKGSARSIDGLDLHAAMSVCAHHCKTFGGHAMAAGLSLEASRIEAYRQELQAAVAERVAEEDLLPKIEIDSEIEFGQCTLAVFRQLERLAPFGRSNPSPRLVVRGATLARPGQRMGGSGKHLSLSLRDDEGHGLRAVGFGLGDLAEELPAGMKVDAVFQPKTNTWRGVTSAELHLLDVRRSGEG